MAKICVIDDDAAVRESLELVLEAEGFAVETFSSANNFLEGDALSDAHCIVTDVAMPGGLSGIELADEVARRQPQCPVIVITGTGSSRLRDAAKNSGATDFFAKPVSSGQLIDAIRRAVGPAA